MSKIQRGYVITKDAADFGVLPLPGGAQALKIPAPLACYWLGRSELESPDLQNMDA
jgi:uncharacterized protein